MKRKSKLKKILIPVVALVLVAAIGTGVWLSVGNSGGEPVNVYAFNNLGMTEYWGDSQESYGAVSTDKIQTVYLSGTQTVTEILVSAGDTVKKGDVLMTFDTTLSDLSLERKRLEVEKLKLQLQDAKKQLARINGMKPMVIPTPSEDDEEDTALGTALTDAYQISHNTDFDGSTAELALICWLNSAASIDDGILDALLLKAEEYQTINANKAAQQEPSSASAVIPETTAPAAEETTAPPTEEPTAPPATEAPTAPPTEEPTAPPATEAPTAPPTEEPTAPPATEAPTTPPATGEPTDPSEGTEPSEPDIEVDVTSFYVVFKVTEGNMSLGARTTWQGIYVSRDDNSGAYRFKFFDASLVQDHTLAPDEEAEETPQIDYGSGYTAAQIAQMRSDQEKTIKDLEFNIKMAEADYKIMQTEVDDGKVYATVDGTVVSVLSEEEATMMQQPLIKVSGGGGFYIEGSISELEKGNMEIGQEVTINDWNTGMTYTGTIQGVSDYPSSDNNWNGLGNPNTTYYPFTVFVDETADLQAGRYVSIQYSSGSAEHGVYLQKPFIRTENGQSFVYVMGEDGKLEQRFVTTGKSLWGSYTEILEGVSEEDFIAFPYGKNVKPGAEAVEADISELYDY